MRFAIWGVALVSACDGRIEAVPSAPCGTEAARIGDLTFVTLRSALESASDGDTVSVCPGTWPAVERIEGRSLALVGLGSSSEVVLDGETLGTVLSLSGAAVTLEHVTLTGGRADLGGGIACDASDVVANDVLVTGNTAEYGGGIAASEGCSITGDALIVSGNSGDRGGGLYSAAALVPNTVSGVELSDNDGGYGAGAYVVGQTEAEPCLTMELSRIEGNHAQSSGGGFWLETSHEGVELVDSEIRSNSAPDSGGGAVVKGGARLKHVVIADNSAGRGGGLFLPTGAAVDLWSPVFHRNGGMDGGGIYASRDTVVDVNSGDFGWSEADQNRPTDVTLASGMTYNFGRDESFLCDGTTCE